MRKVDALRQLINWHSRGISTDSTMESYTQFSSFFYQKDSYNDHFCPVLQIVLDLNDLRKIPTFEERFTLPAPNIRFVVIPTFVILQLWHLDFI